LQTLEKLESFKARARLAFSEWKDLLQTSLKYEFEKRIRNSNKLSPAVESAEWFIDFVQRVSKRGLVARVKVGRLLVRILSAMANQNVKAFESAIQELLDLGKGI
jgi:hypothetical protein